MATQTISHLFDTYEQAARSVADLEAAGVPHSDISIVGSNADDSHATTGTAAADTMTSTATENGTATGATIGTVIGGGAGLLAGIGALAIPGVGPIVAAGWLVATLVGAGAGAAAGGLLGSLTVAGVDEADAHVYAEGVRRGGTLVTVRTDEAQAARVDAMMCSTGTGSVDVRQRGETYREAGWKSFDPEAPAYTPSEVEAERQRMRAGI